MGWEDRDYNQHSAWNNSWGSETPITKRLLIITVVVHFLLWSRKDSLLIAAFTAAVVVGICQLLNVI